MNLTPALQRETEARLAIRENLLATGWALFGYRVALTDAVLADLGFA